MLNFNSVVADDLLAIHPTRLKRGKKERKESIVLDYIKQAVA